MILTQHTQDTRDTLHRHTQDTLDTLHRHTLDTLHSTPTLVSLHNTIRDTQTSQEQKMVGAVLYLRYINYYYESMGEQEREQTGVDVKVVVKLVQGVVDRMGHPVWDTLLGEALKELLIVCRHHYHLVDSLNAPISDLMAKVMGESVQAKPVGRAMQVVAQLIGMDQHNTLRPQHVLTQALYRTTLSQDHYEIQDILNNIATLLDSLQRGHTVELDIDGLIQHMLVLSTHKQGVVRNGVSRVVASLVVVMGRAVQVVGHHVLQVVDSLASGAQWQYHALLGVLRLHRLALAHLRSESPTMNGLLARVVDNCVVSVDKMNKCNVIDRKSDVNKLTGKQKQQQKIALLFKKDLSVDVAQREQDKALGEFMGGLTGVQVQTLLIYGLKALRATLLQGHSHFQPTLNKIMTYFLNYDKVDSRVVQLVLQVVSLGGVPVSRFLTQMAQLHQHHHIAPLLHQARLYSQRHANHSSSCRPIQTGPLFRQAQYTHIDSLYKKVKADTRNTQQNKEKQEEKEKEEKEQEEKEEKEQKEKEEKEEKEEDKTQLDLDMLMQEHFVGSAMGGKQEREEKKEEEEVEEEGEAQGELVLNLDSD